MKRYIMSSSSSIAAARRRRAAPTMPVKTSSGYQTVTPQQMSQSQSQSQEHQEQQQRPVLTPAQMLVTHERRIADIERTLPEIFEQVRASLDSTSTGLHQPQTVNQESSSVNQAFMEERVRREDELVSRLMEAERRISEFHDVLTKIQTFAMEMNTTFMQHLNKASNLVEQYSNEAEQSEDIVLNIAEKDNKIDISDGEDEGLEQTV